MTKKCKLLPSKKRKYRRIQFADRERFAQLWNAKKKLRVQIARITGFMRAGVNDELKRVFTPPSPLADFPRFAANGRIPPDAPSPVRRCRKVKPENGDQFGHEDADESEDRREQICPALKGRAIEALPNELTVSATAIKRYLRLVKLVPELLARVDAVLPYTSARSVLQFALPLQTDTEVFRSSRLSYIALSRAHEDSFAPILLAVFPII